jgi:NAD(P)H-dependent FMN reductase
MVCTDDYRMHHARLLEDPMTLFRLDTSIRAGGSVSREVADSLQRAYIDEHPDSTVVRRDLAADPIPADTWSAAALGGQVPAEQRTPAQRDAAALAATFADELLAADAVVISTALFNFGVSQHLKTWIDLLIADPRFSPGSTPLAGRSPSWSPAAAATAPAPPARAGTTPRPTSCGSSPTSGAPRSR